MWVYPSGNETSWLLCRVLGRVGDGKPWDATVRVEGLNDTRVRGVGWIRVWVHSAHVVPDGLCFRGDERAASNLASEARNWGQMWERNRCRSRCYELQLVHFANDPGCIFNHSIDDFGSERVRGAWGCVPPMMTTNLIGSNAVLAFGAHKDAILGDQVVTEVRPDGSGIGGLGRGQRRFSVFAIDVDTKSRGIEI